MSVLVAAFEPFGGRDVNRGERATRRLRGLPGIEVATLPVSFARMPAAVDALFALRPDVLMLVGESARARGVELERFALNFADAFIPDNDGAQPRAQRVAPGGPLAREVGFDMEAALQAVAPLEVLARASADAGTFVCNAALYHALGRAEAAAGRPVVAFVHVPADKAYLRARAAAKALLALARALAGPGAGPHFI